MRKLGRIALRVIAAVVVLLTICALTAVLIFRSSWFHESVRQRILAEIQRVTGGRAELGGFTFDSARMEAKVGSLVLHGKEQAGDPPFLRVQSVTLGLKIISMIERKIDLASLRLEQPQLRIVFHADGSTNLPDPPHRDNKTWAEDMLNVAIGHYETVDGVFEYDDRKIPLNLRGDDLRAHLDYDRVGSRYRGEFATHRLRLLAGGVGPMEVDASGAFTLEKFRIGVSRLHLATKESHADLTGSLDDVRAPHGAFIVKAVLSVREAVKLLSLTVTPTGSAAFDGKLTVSFAKPFEFALSGRVNARGMGYAVDRVKIDGADLRADVSLTADRLVLRNVTASALGATLTGQATLADWKKFHFEGNLAGLNARVAARMATDRPIPWNGILSGGIGVDTTLGKQEAKVEARLAVAAVPEGSPIQGQLDISYDQAASTVRFGNSYLFTPATRVDFRGTLGETLDVRAVSTNLNDLLPALAMVGPEAPKEILVKLGSTQDGGQATLNGIVSGALNDLNFSGQVEIVNSSVDGHAFDRFSSEVEASRHRIRLTRLNLTRGPTSLEGQAEFSGLEGSLEDVTMESRVNLRNGQLAELAKEAGVTFSIAGTGSANMHLFGSMKEPEAEIVLQVEKPAAFGEQFDRLRADVHSAGNILQVTAGEADAGSGKLRFQGSYQYRVADNKNAGPQNADWKNGELKFDVATEGFSATRAAATAKLPLAIDGTLAAKMTGEAHVVNAEVVIASLNGQASAHGVAIDHEAVGDVTLSAETRGSELGVRMTAQVRGTPIEGEGSWQLEGDYPGTATVRVPKVSIATVHSLVMIGGTTEQKNQLPPFEGFVQGSAKVTASLRKIQDFRADVTLDALQLNPKSTQSLKLGVEAQDIVLKNAKPVEVTVTAKEARIRSAQFVARDTSIEATGGVPFDLQAPADLMVKGAVNLSILQLFNPDLLARGNATVQASVRGSLRDPLVNGRMELKNASLYLADLPNGVDNANGAVLFDRNRATIEKLTAETGGGKISFAGFVEFRDILTYRLQADAQQVRVRYPEDVSVTINSKLALNGTSDSSTLSGTLTINRASFNPRADLGGLLAQAAKPVPAPAAPSDYLRGLQFDVRIESGPNFEFQTSLTRDVEAEVDLRLRGSPLRPMLLGTISVNQGEIQVFGNRYTVNRGDIRFLNPVKIEPTFDMDLETKARAIVVNISFSGTLQKLNVNYSSDPPLQPGEIIALLAVGRDPATSGLAASQASTSSTTAIEAGGGLLGQAVSAQLSSRLQRFFGASRVKIDPTVTAADNLPQARLTLEQQVSKDVTLTYVTNLNRTQEQIVQLQWDLSKHWSAIAVRQDNGLFGIDFQYRKRFK